MIGIVGALLAASAIPVLAQSTGTLRGRVTAANTLRPLAGVQVSILGTGRGSLTNGQGEFLIVNVPSGPQTVRVQMLGFNTSERQVTVQAEQAATVDFVLDETAIALDEVVVTGTAGRQTRRSQPAQVAVVNAAEIVETAPVTSVAQVLQSRLPGVSVTQGSGTTGASQRIRIRGASSISLSNEPLIFIDGVRVDSRTEGVQHPGEGSGSATGTGGQATSRLNDLNPEDIESMEVVKGPAAATLYGADASAGVIQIITKRGQVGGFRQSLTAEYNSIDHSNYTPPDNWAICTQTHLNRGTPACQGLAAGSLISDNPLVREDVFRTGQGRSLNWSGSGGTESFRYYLSLGTSDETGTLPASEMEKRSGRVNVSWTPHPTLTVNAGYGLLTSYVRQPDNNHSLYGFGANAMIGDPLTVGLANDGWLATRRAEHIAAIKNTVDATRNMPSLEVTYQPFSWLTNRVVVGADFSISERLRHIPRNDQNLYRSDHNPGVVRETRSNYRQITLDYLSSVTGTFGAEDQWGSDLALGVQLITLRDDALWADGRGLATNAARVISATASSSGGQHLIEERSIGYLGQYQLGFRDRLFVQVGLRVDQNSSFGEDVEAVFLPKAGASWVLSEEPFFADRVPLFNTLRLRAAYGVTGRAPRPGSAIESWEPRPYVLGTAAEVGLSLNNPGNPDLRPERGSEFEAGIDAGLLDNRLGLELTYFNKITENLLLERELPVSIGYLEDPFANVGKVVNRGVEAVVTAALIQRPALSWDVRLGMNTLHNELLELGDLPPFGQFERFVEGRELSSWFSPRILQVDPAGNVAIVSDTAEYIGSKLPDYEGSVHTDFTVMRNLRLSALFDWKAGFRVFNQTAQYRDHQVVRSREALDAGYLEPEERLRRFGPFRTESGRSVNASEVREFYFQEGDLLRFRELSATYSLPAGLAGRMRADRASITLGANNLALWTKFDGPDPEAISNNASEDTAAFGQYDFFNLPPARRLSLRLNLGF